MHPPAIGTSRLARQFLAAALKVQAPAQTELEEFRQEVSLVAYYLVGHSVELALKTFLIGRGVSIELLRGRKYGHNLAALLTECRRRRMGTVVKLSARELNVIRLINEMYVAKELEYRVTGSRALPRYAEVVSLAERLCKGVEFYAARAG